VLNGPLCHVSAMELISTHGMAFVTKMYRCGFSGDKTNTPVLLDFRLTQPVDALPESVVPTQRAKAFKSASGGVPASLPRLMPG